LWGKAVQDGGGEVMRVRSSDCNLMSYELSGPGLERKGEKEKKKGKEWIYRLVTFPAVLLSFVG